jgi:glycerol-3-phosphate acyltransferase PlsY
VGYVIARARGTDIRRAGSGNIGATNVLRTMGRGPAVATLLLDIAKGYAGAWVGGLAGAEARWTALAAVLVVVGNCWPVFLGFRGGKGVATGLGAFVRATPLAVVPAALVWLVMVLSFRIVSLASLCGVTALPLAVGGFGYEPALTLGALAVAVIIVGRHHDNVGRLWAGTERRLGERS